MAGSKAFWPYGMSIEDLFTLVEIVIEAGSTGKPRQQTDMQAWSTLLPLIRQSLQSIEQAFAMGNIPMANAEIELVKETMLRLGDESDVERFIPRKPPPGSPGAGGPPPPMQPPVTVKLSGNITTAAAMALVQPTLMRDAASQPPQPPPGTAPGAAPTPGQPPTMGPAAPAPGASLPT